MTATVEPLFPDPPSSPSADGFAMIAERLSRIERRLADASAVPPTPADIARSLIRERRRRDAIFADSELFGEPAWDMMLDLFVATAEGRPISVSSACLASARPSTTALRHLSILEARGLIERRADGFDRRRTFVSLSRRGISVMERCLSGSDRTRGAQWRHQPDAQASD